MNKPASSQIRHNQLAIKKAKAKTCYAIRYLHLQERLFYKISCCFTVINLLCGGGTALVLSISEYTTIAIIFGILVTVSTVFDFVVKPDEKSRQCREVRLRFQELVNKNDDYPLEMYQDEECKIGQMQAPTIEGLKLPASIDCFKQNGRKYDGRRLSNWERFLKLIA